jgi:uncharacterized protein YndB with AHSA1/START domain
MEITRTVETATPLDQVFAYLTDFTSTNEWDPGTVETTRTSGDGGVGTRYANTSQFRGRKTQLEYVVRELVPGERFVLEGNNSTIKAVDTLSFSATDSGGTRVVYNADFTYKGLLGLLSPVLDRTLAGAFRALGDEAEVGLQTTLDALGSR